MILRLLSIKWRDALKGIPVAILCYLLIYACHVFIGVALGKAFFGDGFLMMMRLPTKLLCYIAPYPWVGYFFAIAFVILVVRGRIERIPGWMCLLATLAIPPLYIVLDIVEWRYVSLHYLFYTMQINDANEYSVYVPYRFACSTIYVVAIGGFLLKK